jgi:hypothetical protein
VAAAPSEICDELPAVTTPSGLNAGCRPASFSIDVSKRIPSSRVITEPSGRVDRDDLGLESAFLGGLGGPTVRLERQHVEFLTTQAPLVGDHLGGDALWYQAIGVALEHQRAERHARDPAER